MSNFAERIKELRIKNNLTQAEMGTMIGKSDVTINRYEYGYREPSKSSDYIVIAKRFGVSLDWLFGYDSNLPTDLIELLRESKNLPSEQIKLLIDIIRNFK